MSEPLSLARDDRNLCSLTGRSDLLVIEMRLKTHEKREITETFEGHERKQGSETRGSGSSSGRQLASKSDRAQ